MSADSKVVPLKKPVLLVAGDPLPAVNLFGNAYEVQPFPDILEPDPYGQFVGRKVDIWPLNNAAGYRDALDLAEDLVKLHPAPEQVRIAKPADKAYGADWALSDAIEAGWDAKRLVAHAKREGGAWLQTVEVEEVPRGTSVVEPAAQAAIVDSDIANGKRLVAMHGNVLRYTPEREWLIWDGKRWHADDRAVTVQALAKQAALAIYDEIATAGDTAAQKMMFKHAKFSQSRRAIESMIFMARSEPGIPSHLTDYDADPWLLNMANGTLNLKTGKLQPHSQADKITRLVPFEFNDLAECRRWDRFIVEVTGGDSQIAAYLQRMVGYCLTGETTEQVLHFLYGLGANGKSVFCEVLRELLGEYAMIASPEMILTRRNAGIPNDIARLRGCRLALMNETSQGSHFDEQKIKDLTGGDSLTGRFLHAEFFDFTPTHKLVIRGNHKPTISGTDEGIWRRLRLIPFTVQVPTEKRDQRLLYALKPELPGIMNWALNGCLEWQDSRDGLNPPAAVIAAGAEYRVASDTLGTFIAEQCLVRNLAQVKSSVFFKAYQEFCKESGERWLAAKELPDEMRRRGFEPKRISSGSLFLGVELSHADSPPDWRDR